MVKFSFVSLDRRWRRNQARWPSLRWQLCLFISLNMIVIAALLFDGPVGAGASQPAPPTRLFGRALTDFGKSGWILCISAFLLFEGWAIARLSRSPTCRSRAMQISWIGCYLLVTVALSGLLANLLKRMIGRARPEHFDQWGTFGFSPFAGDASFESFPSGHATTIGAVFVAFALFFPRYGALLIAGGLWLGMTRIMVGAHYPSDVIAGLALGGWFSFMTAIVFARYGLVFRIGPDNWPAPRQPLMKT